MHVSESNMRKCIIQDRQTEIFISYQDAFVSFSKQAQSQDFFTCYQIIGLDNKTCTILFIIWHKKYFEI